MTVTEALKIVRQAPRDAEPFEVILACGFTPLHLQTFLHGHLQFSLPGRFVSVKTGLYGDIAGTLLSCGESEAQGVAIAIEWVDLDPRLGYREASRWGTAAVAEIAANVRWTLQRLGDVIERLSARIRCAVSLPTLPLPPMFHTAGWQASESELLFDRMLAEFGSRLAASGAAVVNARRLAEESPAATRMDLKSDLLTGLPHTLGHADTLGLYLAKLIAPPPPKKGIITDLDNTLWSGIAGEVGPEGVHWDVASHAQAHGLYQQLLAALAEQGVLIGIASKNDQAVVERAFQRDDLRLPAKSVFPTEVHWNAKSASVGRILKAWNVGADSVIFVDDSPMELAEVAAAYPEIECLAFPTGNYQATHVLLRRLRDLCGKERLSGDDAIRLESIRKSAEFLNLAEAGAVPEDFLEQANAQITFAFDASGDDARALELVNKTNQFNLNGTRFTEAEWRRRVNRAGAFTATVSYEDKFGPLGRISVIQGFATDGQVNVDAWVMSCRAFARRIEHQVLKTLFRRYSADRIYLEFSVTAKNGPLQDFWASMLSTKPEGPFELSRECFEIACPAVYHAVAEREPEPAR